MKACPLVILLVVNSSFCSDDGDKNKVGPTRGYPVQLATALRDLTKCDDDHASQERILRRINVGLLGGGSLEQTPYSIDDITNKIPHKELWDIAMKKHLWGILSLLGYQHQVQFVDVQGQKIGQ